MIRLLLLSFFLGCMLPSAACLWDRDTLREEAEGRLDLIEGIVGWFDRYPPRYYEMRLERVAAGLAANPAALELYDDAGVACDRLGRYDQAIEWMTRKKAVLDTLADDFPPEMDHRYRYLSNLGTFYLHRWATQPEELRGSRLDDLREAEKCIAAALERNPEAHFGREKFQLMYLQWLLGPGISDGSTVENFLSLEGRYSSHPESIYRRHPLDLREAEKGITGLIHLGTAWENVDIFQTLQLCLWDDRASHLAYLAYLRQKELTDAGVHSLHPQESVRQGISLYPPPGFVGVEKVKAFYAKARKAAEARRSAWVAYQEARFAWGMHPDTHPDFWKDWREPELPKLPGPSLREWFGNSPGLALASCGAGLVIGALLLKFGIRKVSAWAARH